MITVVDQNQKLIARGNDVLNSADAEGNVPVDTFFAWRVESVNFLETTLGKENTFRVTFDAVVTEPNTTHVRIGIALLLALDDGIKNGHAIIKNGWVQPEGGGLIRIRNGHAII